MRKILLIIAILTLASRTRSAGQQDTNELRINIATQFALSLRSDSLSNAEIIERFTAPWNYFKVDSIKAMADQWMNHIRGDYKRFDSADFVVFTYLEKEEEFMVKDNPPGQQFADPVLQKLKFTLHSKEGEDQPVDLTRLYVILTGRGSLDSRIFVLFDENNRIISFSAIAFNSHVGMWQW